MKKKQVISLAVIFLIGILIWFAPHSTEIPDKGWHLFALFVTTIIGVVVKPLPLGALSVIALTLAVVTNTISLEEGLSGFQNEIAWLVILAFFISLGFIRTGLGNRIGYFFVSAFGKNTLGLSYGLLSCDFILSPAVPSVTARAGGVVYPIALSLSKSFGSDPALGTERKIGSFLMKTCFQGSAITSAMFLTAMGANPFLVGLAQDAGISFSWSQWALAALVPGLLSLIAVPYILYKIYPPELRKTPDATNWARGKLKEMGRPSLHEGFMIGIFVILLILWIFGSFFHIKATTAAFVGLCLLLVTGVLTWKDITHEDKAWDTYVWFAILIMLANGLNKHGFTPWFSEQIVNLVHNFHWAVAFGILFLIYFYSHYFFVSNTAHVCAMFPAFLMVAIGVGSPPLLAVSALAFASSLFGGLTHYGSGPAPLYFGAGYVDIKSWWKLGFIISVVNIIIWIGLGSIWWKWLGYW